MANSFFNFRQFRIDQGKCGMKVSTDACVQGAWTPLLAENAKILDVGTGTGLLSLMLAQRDPCAHIDALEIDERAALQATENFAASPFKHRLKCIHTDVRNWNSSSRYDVLICNPPFFKNSLTGPEASRNLARHNLALQQEDLLATFDRTLAPGGYASVLWPTEEGGAFTLLAEGRGWFRRAGLMVKDNYTARTKRVVNVYTRGKPGLHSEEELVIKNSNGSYTEAFKLLMKPFYLNL